MSLQKCYRCHRPCEPELYLRIRGRERPICKKCVDETPDEEWDKIFNGEQATSATYVIPHQPAKPKLYTKKTKKHLVVTMPKKLAKIKVLEKHGKQHLVALRVSPKAMERLKQISQLYHLKPGSYMKAVLYRDLGLWDELMDLRRKEPKKGSL